MAVLYLLIGRTGDNGHIVYGARLTGRGSCQVLIIVVRAWGLLSVNTIVTRGTVSTGINPVRNLAIGTHTLTE